MRDQSVAKGGWGERSSPRTGGFYEPLLGPRFDVGVSGFARGERPWGMPGGSALARVRP